jgi:putative transcriptional regulator
MDADAVAQLRRDLGLSQAQLGQLLGAHFMTVSKWERGILSPDAYQLALMEAFRNTADRKKGEAKKQLRKLLLRTDPVPALAWLLSAR